MKSIVEYVRYYRCSERTKEICRHLSGEFDVKPFRIYGLLRGRKVRNNTEMELLFSLRDLGLIRDIKFRYKSR